MPFAAHRKPCHKKQICSLLKKRCVDSFLSLIKTRTLRKKQGEICRPSLSEVERSLDFGHINPNSIVIVTPILYPDKNKLDISSLKVDKTFDFTRQGTPYMLLSYIQTIAKICNPFFRFLAEGGSSPFPGHYWQTYVSVPEGVNSEVPYLSIE